jgi:hypothetical protein
LHEQRDYAPEIRRDNPAGERHTTGVKGAKKDGKRESTRQAKLSPDR